MKVRSGNNSIGNGSLVSMLGWFSIALGASELLAPGTLRRSIGMPRSAGALIPLYGLREIATGLGLLNSRRPAPWIWARFAGDLLDLATLSPELRRSNPKRAAACAGMAFLAVATLLDFLSARKLDQSDSEEDDVLILPPPDEMTQLDQAAGRPH
jgi:hypothetical protein